MNASQLNTCCGATILTGFGNTRHAIDRSNYSPEEVRTFLKTQEAGLGGLYGQAFLIATLNHEQKEALGHVFEELGWESVFSAYHPGHKSDIYIYVKRLQEIKTREQLKPIAKAESFVRPLSAPIPEDKPAPKPILPKPMMLSAPAKYKRNKRKRNKPKLLKLDRSDY